MLNPTYSTIPVSIKKGIDHQLRENINVNLFASPSMPFSIISRLLHRTGSTLASFHLIKAYVRLTTFILMQRLNKK